MAGTGADAVLPGYYFWDGSKWLRLRDYPASVYESKTNISSLITPDLGCSLDGPTLCSFSPIMNIPDNNVAGLTDTIDFTGLAGTVCDAVVQIRIEHSFTSDLIIYLIAPDRTTVELSSNNGLGGVNYGTGISPNYIYHFGIKHISSHHYFRQGALCGFLSAGRIISGPGRKACQWEVGFKNG